LLFFSDGIQVSSDSSKDLEDINSEGFRFCFWYLEGRGLRAEEEGEKGSSFRIKKNKEQKKN